MFSSKPHFSINYSVAKNVFIDLHCLWKRVALHKGAYQIWIDDKPIYKTGLPTGWLKKLASNEL